MKYVYDAQKSVSNKTKHGVDFEEAKEIWLSENIILEARTTDEKRFMIIGLIGKVCYSCIFTIRDDNVRIISCRKSRKKEKEFYDEKIR